MNVGIIGLGRIGQVHLKALQSVPEIQVVAVSDINEKACESIASAYKIPSYSTDFMSLITDDTIDAIWICSPSNQHYLHVTQALDHGKYVFCEKPLETEVSKIKQLIAQYPDIDKKLMVGFNRRFDPDFVDMKTNIHKVGNPTIVKITSRDPALPSNALEYVKASGGIFKDMTIHDLDMARFMAGDEVAQVCVVGAVNYDKRLEGLDIDTTLVTLQFENGILCNIDNSRVSSYGYDQRLEIHGDQGMIQSDNHKIKNYTVYTQEAIESSVYKNFFLERYEKAYEEEARTFLKSFREHLSFPVSAYDALKALELAEACKISLLENRVVNLSSL